MDTITILHNGQTMVVSGGAFSDILKAVKGSFGGERARFDAARKLWVMPAGFTPARLEKKGFSVYGNLADAQRADRQRREAAADQERAAREARWAREREQRQAEYAAQKQAQARAVAERIRVRVGEYRIGDLLNGKRITGFGQSWTETQPGTWGRHGVRYEETCDGCHRMSFEVDNDTGLCERCGADGETISVCYAYFA